jgi:hypothetical protein
MCIGPMFEWWRETFSAAVAERGVAGGVHRAGLLNLHRSVGALEGKGGRCTPPPLVVEGASNMNEFKLRLESARLSVVALSPLLLFSLRLPSVDDLRDLRMPWSRRLLRSVRITLVHVCGLGGCEKLGWTLLSVFSSSHLFSFLELCAGTEKMELSSGVGLEIESASTSINNSRASSRLP